VAGHVQIGARMLGRAGTDGDGRPWAETGAGAGVEVIAQASAATEAVRAPGADGTLLAVVPIPGTGTSLAIVGYPVTATGAAGIAPDAVSAVLDGPGHGDPAAGGRPGLLLDHDQRRVWADGAEVALTYQEFELLAFLAAHPGTVFSRADLVREVWQRDFAADSRTVDVHVSRLRHKLGPAYGRCLVTEYRVGYQFRPVAR